MFTSVITSVFILVFAFMTLYGPVAVQPREQEIFIDLGALMPTEVMEGSRSTAPGQAPHNAPQKQEAAPQRQQQSTHPVQVSEQALFPGMSSHENGTGTDASTRPGEEHTRGTLTPGAYDSEGNGDTHVLSGRSCIYKPVMSNGTSEEGQVVVDIWVDETGQVTRAGINESLTNTNSEELRRLAVKASLKTKWSEKKGIPEQKGKIAYKFVLR